MLFNLKKKKKKKKKKFQHRVVSTHAVKIWDHLNSLVWFLCLMAYQPS